MRMAASLFTTVRLDPGDNIVLPETPQLDGYLHYPNYVSLLYPGILEYHIKIRGVYSKVYSPLHIRFIFRLSYLYIREFVFKYLKRI